MLSLTSIHITKKDKQTKSNINKKKSRQINSFSRFFANWQYNS